MSFFVAFLFACSMVAVTSNPLPNTPSMVVMRLPPTPSDYPLDKGACAGEWKYLNFDPYNDSDKCHLGTLHNMICSGELRAYLNSGLANARNGGKIYKYFFDDDHDTKAAVADVFLKLAGDDSHGGSTIGDLVKGMVIDNLDFGQIGKTGMTCEGDETFAYTETDPLDRREKIHFCKITWALPEGFDASLCKSLGDRPSDMIDSITRVAMHEMTHYSTVGPESRLEEQIVDQRNEDRETAYGIERAYGLMDPKQDDQPGKAESNADNYAYMAQLAYVSRECSKSDDGTFFPLPPAKYK